MKKIVYIGGGTGAFAHLPSLKNYPVELSAIFPVTDDGGSTGRLIKDLDLLPMGDLRKLIIALSGRNNQSSKFLEDLFDFRFPCGELAGHSFGNIFLACLMKMKGSINEAILSLEGFLNTKIRIQPVSLKRATLCALFANGKLIKGESNIDEVNHPWGHLAIKKIFTRPKIALNPRAKLIINQADLIIFGPGDLYTSIIPCLIVLGMKKTLQNSKARKVYICNLMTKFGQTHGFRVSDFVKVMEKYLGKDVLDFVVYNTEIPSRRVLNLYKKENDFFVKVDKENFVQSRTKFIGQNLVSKKMIKKDPCDVLKRSLIRHDSSKVARLIMKKILK